MAITMASLIPALLLTFASTVAAKGGKVKSGTFGGSSMHFQADYMVPISTGVTLLCLIFFFFTYFRLSKKAPMFWCLILVFVAQVINLFTGLSTAIENFGDKLPATWGIADAFSTFFLMVGNILVFLTVQRAIFPEKNMKFAGKTIIFVWTAAMFFGAGYIWGLVVRYSLAWKDIHNFLQKHENDDNTPSLDREYAKLWNSYMTWNSRMRKSIVGVNGGYLVFCLALIVLSIVRRKVLTKKEKIYFPALVLLGRLLSLLATVSLQASFLWKGGEWSSKQFTIAVWVIVAWSWILTLGGYQDLIKNYRKLLNPKSNDEYRKSVSDDEEAAEGLTGGESGGQTVYPQGSNAAGGDYGYAPMTAAYPTYAPTDTQYSRTSYEATSITKKESEFGKSKKDKKGKKDKQPEIVGKSILDRIGEVVPPSKK